MCISFKFYQGEQLCIILAYQHILHNCIPINRVYVLVLIRFIRQYRQNMYSILRDRKSVV